MSKLGRACDGARRRGRAATLAAALLAVWAGSAAADATPPEPADYRMDDYRSPTPATLQGARVIDTKAAEAMWRGKSAVFLDTMPRVEKPSGLPPGTIWRDKPRDNIPGSAWLGNVGYGALSVEMDRYFHRSLETLAGDRSKPLVFYCRADCWMSWNAAKRALAWGYRDVVWYPEGSDGWVSAGLPTEAATPYAPPAPAPSH
jgi:PQQ-dependent catabolism-associated CXXCW motif protein